MRAAFELSRFFLPRRAARQTGHLLTFNLPAGCLAAPPSQGAALPTCGSWRTRLQATAVRMRLVDDAG